jgi:hypothetical protein
MSSTSEVSLAVLKSGLAAAAKVCEKGESSDKTIDTALQHIRSRQPLSMLDEARVRGWLERELPEAIRAGRSESKSQETSDAKDANQLYRMVGPGRLSPVGKPPFIFPPLWLYRLIDGQAAHKLSDRCLWRRKIIALSIAAAVLFIGLFPPWIQTYDLNSTHTQTGAGYAFIWSPPAPRDYSYSIGIKLDITRLSVELVAVLTAGFGAWFLFADEKTKDKKS